MIKYVDGKTKMFLSKIFAKNRLQVIYQPIVSSCTYKPTNLISISITRASPSPLPFLPLRSRIDFR